MRFPDSKAHGVNMGPTWVLSAPDEPHVGPMNLSIRVTISLMFARLLKGTKHIIHSILNHIIHMAIDSRKINTDVGCIESSRGIHSQMHIISLHTWLKPDTLIKW